MKIVRAAGCITRRSVVAGLAGSAIARSVSAAPASDFYRGKTLTTVVGFAPGGGVDTAARIIARHLVRFIPGSPRSLVQNFEGAAGVVAANYVTTRVAPDGLTIAVPGRSWFVEGVTNGGGVRFDSTKLSYVGSPGTVNSVIYIRTATGIGSFAELMAARRTFSFGALASNTTTAMVPAMLARQGAPIKVVFGYGSSARIIVALEQGEADGMFTAESTFGLRQDLLDRKILTVILQNKPVHPGIPLLRDVIPESEHPVLNLVMAQESFGLPVVGPPGIPSDRLEILRTAFAAMCNDPEYKAEAHRVALPVGEPVSGAQLAIMINELKASATPDVVTGYKRLGAPQ
jgi:tripartite-type tricarboxylate transporter receptor subunit TctC